MTSDAEHRGKLGFLFRSAASLVSTTVVTSGLGFIYWVVAARFFLQEGLALDGRPNSCGADSIHTDEEVSALSLDQQTWLRNYLQTQRDRQPVQAGHDAGIGASR